MNYKPFDLEAAKAGAPLITRYGYKAYFIGIIPKIKRSGFAFIAMVGDKVWRFREDGSCFEINADGLDLLMAPVKKKLWVGLFRTADGSAISSTPACSTEAEIREYGSTLIGEPVCIEYEE